MRSSSVGGVNQGIFSSSILPTIGSIKRFTRTSEPSIIIQVMSHRLDVIPVTFYIMGIIHIDICSVML